MSLLVRIQETRHQIVDAMKLKYYNYLDSCQDLIFPDITQICLNIFTYYNLICLK